MRLWHQKPPSQSMHRSLQLGAALGILLPAVVFTSIQMLTRYEDHLESRLRAPMQQYADMLEHALATALWATDIQTTQKLVDAGMDNPDVASITVRDEHDEVIEEFRKQSDGSYLVACSADLDDLYDLFDMKPSEDRKITTVARNGGRLPMSMP